MPVRLRLEVWAPRFQRQVQPALLVLLLQQQQLLMARLLLVWLVLARHLPARLRTPLTPDQRSSPRW